MAFIVGSPCVGCKDTACVKVCPVDCFYEGPDMLYIDPEECIDCALCEPECPVEAIFADDELPPEQIPFIEINEKGAEKYRDQNITDQKEPLAHESPYTVEEAIKVVQID
jgi:ferredoxin